MTPLQAFVKNATATAEIFPERETFARNDNNKNNKCNNKSAQYVRKGDSVATIHATTNSIDTAKTELLQVELSQVIMIVFRISGVVPKMVDTPAYLPLSNMNVCQQVNTTSSPLHPIHQLGTLLLMTVEHLQSTQAAVSKFHGLSP